MKDNKECTYTTKQVDELVNEMYPGMMNFVCDLNLTPKQETAYKKNAIFKAVTFINMTHRVWGMAASHRYYICTNRAKDLSSVDEEGVGWCMLGRNQRFQILGTYKVHDKTAIILLHLPDDARWEMFKDIRLNLNEKIVEMVKKSMDNKALLDPIPELTSEDWLEACSVPIGLDKDDNLISPDNAVEDYN